MQPVATNGGSVPDGSDVVIVGGIGVAGFRVADGSAATPARLNFLQRLETHAIRPATCDCYVHWTEAAAIIRR